MSFAAPEPIINNTSRDCVKCGLHVKRTRSESWEFGKCPACWGREYMYQKIPNVDNSNPLLTVVKPAFVNPFTAYLDKYTPFEMENVK